MAENKTKQTEASVDTFLQGVDQARRKDCQTLIKLMRRVTGQKPKMWGTSIVGFGSYHYKYASGREGDYPLTGFSPRKNDLTLYLMAGFERHEKLMAKLGKHKTGKSCLYVKNLSDVDLELLEELVKASVSQVRRA